MFLVPLSLSLSISFALSRCTAQPPPLCRLHGRPANTPLIAKRAYPLIGIAKWTENGFSKAAFRSAADRLYNIGRDERVNSVRVMTHLHQNSNPLTRWQPIFTSMYMDEESRRSALASRTNSLLFISRGPTITQTRHRHYYHNCVVWLCWTTRRP